MSLDATWVTILTKLIKPPIMKTASPALARRPCLCDGRVSRDYSWPLAVHSLLHGMALGLVLVSINQSVFSVWHPH